MTGVAFLDGWASLRSAPHQPSSRPFGPSARDAQAMTHAKSPGSVILVGSARRTVSSVPDRADGPHSGPYNCTGCASDDSERNPVYLRVDFPMLMIRKS